MFYKTLCPRLHPWSFFFSSVVFYLERVEGGRKERKEGGKERRNVRESNKFTKVFLCNTASMTLPKCLSILYLTYLCSNLYFLLLALGLVWSFSCKVKLLMVRFFLFFNVCIYSYEYPL